MKRSIVYTYIALYFVLIYIFGNIFDNSSLETQVSLGIMAATPVLFVIAVIHIICRLLGRRKKKSSPSRRHSYNDHHGSNDTRTSHKDDDRHDNDSNDGDSGGDSGGGGDGGGGDGGD